MSEKGKGANEGKTRKILRFIVPPRDAKKVNFTKHEYGKKCLRLCLVQGDWDV